MNKTIKLTKNFENQLNKLQETYGTEFNYLNGLSEEQLSGTDFLDRFIATAVVADSSIDGNANIKKKDMVTLSKEMGKPEQKLIAYHKIYLEMNQKYGFRTANKWLEKEWNKELYLHDANKASFFPYCYAYDLKRLAEEGLFFTDIRNPKPAQHLITFIDFVKEYISFAANRTSGACGLPNLIPYMFYFWKKDIDSGYWTGDPEKYAKQNIQRFIFAVNQPYVRDGIQSAFTNTSVFDHEYLVALFGGAVFPDGTFMVDYLEDIMQFQKWYMEEFSDIRDNNLFTFPVNTINLLTNEDKTEFVDDEFARWAIEHNMKWNDSNIFADNSVTSLSNCCRLKSNITDLGYFNSIGGTSLRVGSVKVSTINLARIALQRKSEKAYLKQLEDTLLINLQMLDCQRDIIKKNIERGLLTNYGEGLIDLSTQYSTIGVMGIYETMKTFGYTYRDEFGNTFYKDKAFEFGKKIFDTIHRVKGEFQDGKDYMINVEAVPGEACAVKFLQADTLLYPDKVVQDLPLYGNQFIPLGIKTTVQERIRIASAFDEYCSGGSILHLNLDAPFTNFDTAYAMTKYIIKEGVSYFAFNPTLSVCKNSHTYYGKYCPICGEEPVEKYSRIVGFMTPISSWSKERRAEFNLREWHPLEHMDDVLK